MTTEYRSDVLVAAVSGDDADDMVAWIGTVATLACRSMKVAPRADEYEELLKDIMDTSCRCLSVSLSVYLPDCLMPRVCEEVWIRAQQRT